MTTVPPVTSLAMRRAMSLASDLTQTWRMTQHDIWHNMTYDTMWRMTQHDIWHNMTYDTTWRMTQHHVRPNMTYDTTWSMTQHDIWHNVTYDTTWHMTQPTHITVPIHITNEQSWVAGQVWHDWGPLTLVNKLSFCKLWIIWLVWTNLNHVYTLRHGALTTCEWAAE